ncbi:MAG: mannose-1-phosphate guanylyltransferase [Candidatus Acidiferrales bacterium]
MTVERIEAHAVILAGGRGTRFWPRSRTRTPKQLLNIVGDTTMLEQTVARLAPIFLPSRTWVVTNTEQAAAVRAQMPRAARAQVLTEPAGRNTAAAIGLAAVHLLHRAHGRDALMAVLPADHYIAQAERYRRIVRAALDAAGASGAPGPPGTLVVLGIPPTRPETGFGYIERGAREKTGRVPIYAVHKFTEKPDAVRARRYVASGRYYWNAGMFFWRASTYLAQLKRFLPATHDALLRLAETIGTRRYRAMLDKIYPRLQNISVDYAVLEPATRARGAAGVSVIPAEVGWSDIGSWAAVYELLAKKSGENVAAGKMFALDSAGNFLWSPHKFIAAIGLHNFVVVETPDALLVCPRERSQDVAKVVRWLEEHRLRELL